MTDQQLIDGAIAGSEAAIRALYERYASRVYATIYRLAGGDSALAEDWAQEAWISAIRALPTFRGGAQFSTWLHRIAVNAALQGLRKQQRREGPEIPLPDEPLADPNRDRPLLRYQIEQALASLPAGMRQVLVLHDVEGYTHEEIAASLEITVGTSKSQLFKARARMRELLGGSTATVQEI